MPSFSNPSDIARETFRLIATRRIPPTPENYRTVYHEVAGTAGETAQPFPAEQMKALLQALPRETPAQLRLQRELDQACRDQNWNACSSTLAAFIREQGKVETLPWGELINSLLREWDATHISVTPGKKRDALEHLFASAGNNAEALFNRLQNLLRAWSQGGHEEEALRSAEPGGNETASAEVPESARKTATPAAGNELLPQMREVLAFALETAVATQIVDLPELTAQAHALAEAARKANSIKAFNTLLADLKRFAFRLELVADDRSELREGLLQLLRLLPYRWYFALVHRLTGL